MNNVRSLPKKIVLTILFYIVALIATAFFLIPLWQTFVGAFSSLQEVMTVSFRAFPQEFTWNLPRLFEIAVFPSFPRMVWNSFFYAGAVIPMLFFSSLAAFALSRLKGPGQGLIFGIILSTIMLPFTTTMIPRFIMFREFGWIDTALVFYGPAIGGNAMVIFLLRQFMKNIPRDLDEAAKIDGAGYFRIYATVIMPLSKPALAVTFIFSFIGAWNDFMGPLIFLTRNSNFPLPLGIETLRNTIGNYITEWNVLMLAVLISSLPLLAIFFIFQRHIIKGVVMSGIKG